MHYPIMMLKCLLNAFISVLSHIWRLCRPDYALILFIYTLSISLALLWKLEQKCKLLPKLAVGNNKVTVYSSRKAKTTKQFKSGTGKFWLTLNTVFLERLVNTNPLRKHNRKYIKSSQLGEYNAHVLNNLGIFKNMRRIISNSGFDSWCQKGDKRGKKRKRGKRAMPCDY